MVFIIVGSERLGIGVADRGGFNFWRWLSLIFFAVDFLPKENLLKTIFDWSVHRNGFQKLWMSGISEAIWISFRIYAFDVDHISNRICRIELVGWEVESISPPFQNSW